MQVTPKMRLSSIKKNVQEMPEIPQASWLLSYIDMALLEEGTFFPQRDVNGEKRGEWLIW